jgi:TonB family protein
VAAQAPQQRAPDTARNQGGATAPVAPGQQTAKLTPPLNAGPGGAFQGAGPMSPGAVIEQAARAAAANRGGYGGSGGDYGLGRGQFRSSIKNEFDVLSDTMGVDFGPYLARVLEVVRMNWYNIIPESARAPLMKKGKVSIEFAILKDGQVRGMRLVQASGDISLDRAAIGGISASNPFPPLPNEFGGQYLALRFYFLYNPDANELR